MTDQPSPLGAAMIDVVLGVHPDPAPLNSFTELRNQTTEVRKQVNARLEELLAARKAINEEIKRRRAELDTLVIADNQLRRVEKRVAAMDRPKPKAKAAADQSPLDERLMSGDPL
jgi:hypothetical protein